MSGVPRCELILVNNNSQDATVAVAENMWKSLGSPFPLRLVEEPIPGLSHARAKGMGEAVNELMIWCDDDNWLCDRYVQTVYEIMSKDPKIGALGGWCEAAFETEKPDWFDAQARYFAVSRQGKKSGDITSKKGCVYGAGMGLRKSHWEQLNRLGFCHLLNDRTGKSLSSGGDTEYCYALRLLGYKMWFDDRLYFKHFMSSPRLTLDYVSKMRKSMAYSNFILWPYLDLLSGKTRTQLDFLKETTKGFPLRPVKKAGALVVGNYEQKEVAKRYFKHLYYRLFFHAIYIHNLKLIKTWLN